MRKILFLVPLFLLGCSSITDVTPDDTFVKYFGDASEFEVKDMIKSTDGDGDEYFVILASRLGEVENNEGIIVTARDFYIVSIDERGELIHELRIPFVVPEILNGTQEIFNENFVLKTPSRITRSNGGFLLIGSQSVPHKTLVDETASILVWAEVDADFNLLDTDASDGIGPVWRAVGDSVNNFYGIDISPMTDGGVLVAGYTDQNGDNDYFYKKIGGTLDEWERTQSRPGSDDQLVRALLTENGNYALVGRTDQLSEAGEGGANVERTIINVDGVIQNSAVYGTTTFNGNPTVWDIPHDLIERPGGFSIVGVAYETSSLQSGTPFFMNVDLVGAAVTKRVYLEDFNPDYASTSTVDFQAKAFGLTRMATNDLLVVGQTESFEDNITGRVDAQRGLELMLFTTNQSGVRTSEILQFGLENGDEAGLKTLATSDGSVLIAGNYDFGGGLQQIAVLKVNTSGQLKQ